MSENKVKKCPKCGGEMKEAYLHAKAENGMQVNFEVSEKKPGFFDLFHKGIGKIYPIYCRDCGYVELYMEKKE